MTLRTPQGRRADKIVSRPMVSEPQPLVAEIIATLRLRYKTLNRYYLYYEAAWTESWRHRFCYHTHETLIDAAKCAMPHGAGWYMLAVEGGRPRELTEAEDEVVNEFRFG